MVSQMVCNIEIDYSTIIGSRILPFIIELDLTKSRLYPEPGENQKFCYNIKGTGSDTSLYADLSHIVFGICNQISKDKITNITVFINDIEQEVIFGDDGNVSLKTEQKPDPPTGCPGLKFDFGLNKINGIMSICYELLTPYPIGANNVCLFGGNVTAEGLSICGPVCKSSKNCNAIGYKEATVCVPVNVKPYANILSTTTYCCGEPIIVPGPSGCTGTLNGKCNFTIKQNICISIPIEFGANTFVGAPSIECDIANSKDICTDCDEAQY